jgi:hypothetical protein
MGLVEQAAEYEAKLMIIDGIVASLKLQRSEINRMLVDIGCRLSDATMLLFQDENLEKPFKIVNAILDDYKRPTQ